MLLPDSRRVLVRPFISADPSAVGHIIERAMALPEDEIERQVAILLEDFAPRHQDLVACWERHFSLVAHRLGGHSTSQARRRYIGALFSGEYALESAALFNPSMVAHPDQSGLQPGALRFILSLRATGEGHISSIEFRSGVLQHGEVTLDPVSSLVIAPAVKENPEYLRENFHQKLREMGFDNQWASAVLSRLGGKFTRDELRQAVQSVRVENGEPSREIDRTMECVDWLALSNYEIQFSSNVPLSQRIIFPVSPNESNGIEDARFVRFVDNDGAVLYCATYTAYNGRAILPQLIETRDFLHFKICTLNGQAAQNKGMALFPRRIGGRFAMISRQDDESLYIMFSDNRHFWNEPRPLARPTRPWEFVKIGNCGSPIETKEGWLLLTHGVGAMRRYCIGAMLLDLEDPSRVLGVMHTPLIEPTGERREGYVPNVVYSCGGLLHEDRLVLPYALSDSRSTIGTVDLDELLAALRSVEAGNTLSDPANL